MSLSELVWNKRFSKSVSLSPFRQSAYIAAEVSLFLDILFAEAVKLEAQKGRKPLLSQRILNARFAFERGGFSAHSVDFFLNDLGDEIAELERAETPETADFASRKGRIVRF